MVRARMLRIGFNEMVIQNAVPRAPVVLVSPLFTNCSCLKLDSYDSSLKLRLKLHSCIFWVRAPHARTQITSAPMKFCFLTRWNGSNPRPHPVTCGVPPPASTRVINVIAVRCQSALVWRLGSHPKKKRCCFPSPIKLFVQLVIFSFN